MTRRPRIGITTYVEPARWGSWDRDAALLPHSYVAAVVAGGGAPVLLPPVPDAADAVLDGIEGLLISGGADVDPARYGQTSHATTDRPRADRDDWESALLLGAIDRGLPVLAVCRGLQLVNVALGGTLHQHLPEVCGHEGHRPELGSYGRTAVSVAAGSALAAIAGVEHIEVPCHHHQAVDRVADGLVVTGTAADGTVEAVEAASGRGWLVAVQWHPEDSPEASPDRLLFAALSAQAREALAAQAHEDDERDET